MKDYIFKSDMELCCKKYLRNGVIYNFDFFLSTLPFVFFSKDT